MKRSFTSVMATTFESDVASAIVDSIGAGSVQSVELAGSFGSGGGGCSAGEIIVNGQSYFYKQGGIQDYDMLRAEYEGNREMSDTNTIRVPRPIAVGTSDYSSYAVFERLEMGGRGDAQRYAKDLVAMHRCSSGGKGFGWKMNNTCGATPQINTWEMTWADFWCKHRLGQIISLSKREGASFENEKEIISKTHEILTAHETEHDLQPSLVHGDLWSGNQAFCKDGTPCIYDPATYYGDREVDIAMTKLFGSNSREFYDSYDNEWALPEGWQERQVIYNTYHILNHFVLFGGGYLQQGKSMLNKVLSF